MSKEVLRRKCSKMSYEDSFFWSKELGEKDN